MAAIAGIERVGPGPLIDRHMDVPCIRDLYFDANLQSVVAGLFGKDLFLWRSNFFIKHQLDRDGRGTGENIWHHDRHFESGDAPINLFDTSNHFTVLVALTDVGMNAGRLEYVRGAHLPIEGFDRDIPRHIKEVPRCRSGQGHPAAAPARPVCGVSFKCIVSQPGFRRRRRKSLIGRQACAGRYEDSGIWRGEPGGRGADSRGAQRLLSGIGDIAVQLRCESP